MAVSKAIVMLMFVAVMSALSAAFAQVDPPAPSPDAGAGTSLPFSAAAVASSLVASLVVVLLNN